MEIEEYKNKFAEVMKEKDIKKRNLHLASIMTEMESRYNIPMLNDEEYNRNNKEVIELYKEIADARVFDEN